STTVAADALSGFQPHAGVAAPHSPSGPAAQGWSGWTGWSRPEVAAQVIPGLNERSARVEESWPDAPPHEAAGAVIDPLDYPLGAARAQLHANYIVAQTRDGLVVVDQHAAHERLVYERMKAQMAEGAVARQALLTPEV